MRDLSGIRDDLNRCDKAVLELLRKRLGYIAELTEYKKEHGLSVFEPVQEKWFEELIAGTEGAGCRNELLRIFKQISEESKCVQSKILFHDNIALIGFMGTGKSTVSGYLKDMLAMKEVDVDSMIAQEQKMPVKDIFAKYGEEFFRNCESSAIVRLNGCRQTIISCGGGAVIREENVKNLKKSSRIVLLTASPKTVLERVKNSDERPILNGNMNVEFIKGLMEKREDYYRKAADVIVETDHKSIRQICEELIASLMRLDQKREL